GRADALGYAGRDELVGDRDGRVDAPEDQRGRHQRAAAHAGQADDDADAEADEQQRQRGGGAQVGHQASHTPARSRARTTSSSVSSIVRPVVSTRTRASSGSSYGEEIPVKSGISPARALAYRPLRLRRSHS